METREAFEATNQRFLDSSGKPLAPPDEVEHGAIRLAPSLQPGTSDDDGVDPEVRAQFGTGGMELPPVPAGQRPPETRIQVAIHVDSQDIPTVHFLFPAWALVLLGELHHQGAALLGDGAEAEGDSPLPVLLGALLQ